SSFVCISIVFSIVFFFFLLFFICVLFFYFFFFLCCSNFSLYFIFFTFFQLEDKSKNFCDCLIHVHWDWISNLCCLIESTSYWFIFNNRNLCFFRSFFNSFGHIVCTFYKNNRNSILFFSTVITNSHSQMSWICNNNCCLFYILDVSTEHFLITLFTFGFNLRIPFHFFILIFNLLFSHFQSIGMFISLINIVS